MNKGLFSFFFLLTALFMGASYYTNTLQSPILNTLNKIKLVYHSNVEFIENSIEKYLFQAKTISELNEKLVKYEKNHLVMQELASEIDDLLKENSSNLKINPKVELVRTISYESFGNLNRIWLEVNEYNSSKIYGLTYKELVAGIVIAKDSKALAILNNDSKSTYAVFIGKENATGIVRGNNDGTLSVNFIPAWYKIKIDDEVITSGLDNIFFKGLRVGKILSITKSQGYQNAIIEPYYIANEPNYFHLIKKVK